MLQAAMTHVLGEVAWVRKAYPPGLLAKPSGTSVGALTVRNSITKGGFAELRRHGYPLTGEFLNLEGEIDNFARQYEDRLTNASVIIREGKQAGLGEQLTAIEDKAFVLREKALASPDRLMDKLPG